MRVGDEQAAHTFDSWPIVRATEGGFRRGVALGIFIRNGDYFHTSLDVYEDGAVDCWGFLDLDLFRKKLLSGWISTAPEEDRTINIHHLAYRVGFAEGQWFQPTEEVRIAAEQVLASLNPDGIGLIDMEGSDTVKAKGGRRAKMGLSNKKSYRMEEGKMILGLPVHALQTKGDHFRLARLTTFEDGRVQISGQNRMFSLDEIAEGFRTGLLHTRIPAGGKIVLPGLGQFRTRGEFGYVEPASLLAEMNDNVGILNGNPSAVQRCVGEFRNYLEAPSEEGRARLREAYEMVPEHRRQYCGNMDTRDGPIREIIYGGEEGAGTS